MMPRATLTRRLAEALVRHAATVMPGALIPWARAIQNELTYVDDDREALKWAVSCGHLAYAARLRHLYLLDLLPVRVAGIALAASCAFETTYATALTTAYRLQAIGMTEILARMTPGNDYRRLIPLLEAIPPWLHALLFAGGSCYLLAIFCLLRRRRETHTCLFLGLTVTVAARALGRSVIEATGVVVVPSPSLLSAVLWPIVFPFILALAAWSGSGREPGRRRAA